MSRPIHLATRIGTLCGSHAAQPATTGSPADLTCKRCLRRMETLNYEGHGDLLERRHAERTRAAVEAVGMAPIIDFLATQDDSAYVHMTTGILGSVAVWLHESGFVALAAEQQAAA